MQREYNTFDGLVDDANADAGGVCIIKTQTHNNVTPYCLECEEEIPEARRLAVSKVNTCVECQISLERCGVGRVRAL